MQPKRIIENNRLVQRVWDPSTQRIVSHGKRVPKDFPLPAACRKAYIKSGFLGAVVWLRENQDMPFQEACDFIKEVRGDDQFLGAVLR